MQASIAAVFGTELPIVQAPMSGSQGSRLAIAVSNAGGLGSLGAAMLMPDALRNELAALAAGTTKPYNVNFFVHEEPVFDAARDQAWRRALAPYYKELGVDPSTIAAPARRPRFDASIIAVLEEFKPRVVSFHFGLPDHELVMRVKALGAKIISSATTAEEARYLESHGADAVIAQGLEAGGHRGMFLTGDITTQVGTLALVRQIVRTVRVPVIAAGGIGDAESAAAAMALGAAGVQAGTAYLLCPEATTSAAHRAALMDVEQPTAITNVFSGRPARSVVNRLMREIGPISPAAPAFPLAGAALVPLRARAEAAGSRDFTAGWAGQNRRIHGLSAGALTMELARLIKPSALI
jgi:nitronate monooxygenase